MDTVGFIGLGTMGTKRTYDEAVADGYGKEDFSAVTHVIEKRIGRRLSAK